MLFSVLSGHVFFFLITYKCRRYSCAKFAQMTSLNVITLSCQRIRMMIKKNKTIEERSISPL